MTHKGKPETPLTVEMLIRALQSPRVRTAAGYMGTCEQVPRLDKLVDELMALIASQSPKQEQ